MTDAATPAQPRTAAGLCPDCGHGMHLHSPLNAKESYWLCAWWDRVANRQCSCRLAIEAQARPAVASERLRAALLLLVEAVGNADLTLDHLNHREVWHRYEQARVALASDAGRSVGALDVERLARALRTIGPQGTRVSTREYAAAIAAAYDAEREGEQP